MTTLTVKRARALSSAACRSAQSSRLVHSSSINHATALSSASLADDIEEITIQPIFDIFDAPTRLAESSAFIRNAHAKTSTSSSSVSTKPSSARSTLAPLPQPILFDGPARPQNAALAFQSRLRDAGLRAPSSPSRASKNTAPTRPFSSSEPLVQLFDGPARITRYHHQPSGSSANQQNSAKYVAALGVVGAVGYATLAMDTEGR
ncbi:hypothetical protein BDN70DRAFT_928678 [Pholiota conissans]|uniref:Uncharacterized protein n=1 Tax=Pholiota conissans TaxID=109636 RepID=A0A9P5ZAU3_9AGAR|nr:hypothetical protein BDN70DRAFT_928678 [Pholiota conissans]